MSLWGAKDGGGFWLISPKTTNPEKLGIWSQQHSYTSPTLLLFESSKDSEPTIIDL